MMLDVLTKNLELKTFQRHIRAYVGNDPYYIWSKEDMEEKRMRERLKN